MSVELNKLIIQSIPNQEKSNELIGRLFDVAKAETVFSPPVVQGEYAVITASEVTVGMGAGYGGGGGVGPQSASEKTADDTDGNGQEPVGVGGGGGGGGSAVARPVAAVIVGPEGVYVEQIVDPTKIAVAFFTTLAAMLFSISKMMRKR